MAKTETVARSLGLPAWTGVNTLRKHALAFGITALLLWVVAAPIIMLVLSSLREGNFITPGAFTLGNYRTVYLNQLTYPALLNTLIYATAVSAISLDVRHDLCLARRTHRYARDELGLDDDAAAAGDARHFALHVVDSAPQPAQRHRQCLPARLPGLVRRAN